MKKLFGIAIFFVLRRGTEMTKPQRIVLTLALFLVYPLISIMYSEKALPNDAPIWFTKPPSDIAYYYGVGYSAKDPKDADAEARINLIMGIATTIHAEVDQETHSVVEGSDEKTKNEFRTRSRSYAKQEALQGLEISKRHRGAGKPEYYSLARLSREKFSQQMQNKQADMEKIVAHGDNDLGDGKVLAALKAYNHAFEIAQALAFFYEDTSNVSEKTVSVYDILRKIDDLQDNLNILAISGSGQTGNYGSPLSDPLIVQVQYKEVPLGNFPLQATYIHGIGLLRNDARETDRAIRIYTDAEGTGICWVEAVQSITRDNHIQITADPESIQLPSAKAVIFRYTSVFPTHSTLNAPSITLNGSTDEQTFVEGSTVDIEIRVPHICHIHLFSIVADGKFSYLQSVPIVQDSTGKSWRALATESGWVLQMDKIPVTAEYGAGIETLLVISTKDPWKPNAETFTSDGLIQQLDRSVGAKAWHAGWVSYHLKTERTP